MPDSEIQDAGGKSIDAALDSIERHGARVWSLARRFTPDARAAQRALQAIFAALWDDDSDLTRWADERRVLAVARRVLLERRPPGDPGGLLRSTLPDVDAQASLFSEGGPLRRALGELRPERRVVLELAVIQGWAYAQIAVATDLSEGDVARHARQGLVELRERLHRGADAEPEQAPA